MKKPILFLFLSSLLFLSVNATTHIVTVANFQFSPANLTGVMVGDTIEWSWENGGHTTTGRTGEIPAGATAWDNAINSANTSFKYEVTVEGVYNYVCTIHEDGGMIASFTATGSLPVILSQFSVSNIGKGALLTWKTEAEINTDHFSIKRSTDGNNFVEINKVTAAGASHTSILYRYTDNNISLDNKYYYYLLDIIDKDGHKQSSQIKMFRNSASVSKLITHLSPNPISRQGHLMLQFNADKAGTMDVQLFDANGALVKQTKMAAVEGLNNGHFHLSGIPAGLYKIIFTLEGIKEIRSIVIQ